MADLIETSASAGLLPVTIGNVTLQDVAPGAIASVAPLSGAEKSTSAALKKHCGAAFPAAGRVAGGAGGLRAIWSGRGQALVMAEAPGDLAGELAILLKGKAAVTDQSDAWTTLALQGRDVRRVLARLTPLDLRPATFGRGQTARSTLVHMMAVITCTAADRFEIMVMRSMTQSAVHDITRAMQGLAARAAL